MSIINYGFYLSRMFFFFQNLVKRNQFKLTFLVKGLTKLEGGIDQRGGSIKVDVSTFSATAFS